MLVNCVAYKDGKKDQDVAVPKISEYLSNSTGFIWIALFDPEPSELDEVKEQLKLPALAIEDILKASQRPKFEEYEQGIFLVMQAFELPPKQTEVLLNQEWRAGEVHVFAGPNFVLSVRRNYTKGFQDVRERCEREPHLLKMGSGFVLYALLDSMVDRYFPLVSRIEEDLETLEEAIFTQERPRENIELLYLLKHKIISLKHATSELTEAVGKMHGGRVPTICSGVQDYFRDVVDHLHRINNGIETTREMLITAIHVNLTLISIGDSQVSKKLAAWAAIIAVPTMIAGIYGMNFKHMPELEHQMGYPLALAVMLFVDGFLFYRFKKTKWI